MLAEKNLVGKRKHCKLLVTCAAYLIIYLIESIRACQEGDLGHVWQCQLDLCHDAFLFSPKS